MIDITFDVRTDSGGKDPDKYSGTLRKYHRVLWSKPLPNGKYFDLDDTNDYVYLSHRSEMGNFYLCLASTKPAIAEAKSLPTRKLKTRHYGS